MIGGFLFEVSYAGDSSTNSFQGGNDVVLRAVPEPGTGTLLMVGLAGVLMRRSRRSK
jgi:hypothetical protein